MDLPRYGFCPMTSLKCLTQFKTILSISFKDDGDLMQRIKYAKIRYLQDSHMYAYQIHKYMDYRNFVNQCYEYCFILIQSSKFLKVTQGEASSCQVLSRNNMKQASKDLSSTQTNQASPITINGWIESTDITRNHTSTCGTGQYHKSSYFCIATVLHSSLTIKNNQRCVHGNLRFKKQVSMSYS